MSRVTPYIALLLLAALLAAATAKADIVAKLPGETLSAWGTTPDGLALVLEGPAGNRLVVVDQYQRAASIPFGGIQRVEVVGGALAICGSGRCALYDLVDLVLVWDSLDAIGPGIVDATDKLWLMIDENGAYLGRVGEVVPFTTYPDAGIQWARILSDKGSGEIATATGLGTLTHYRGRHPVQFARIAIGGPSERIFWASGHIWTHDGTTLRGYRPGALPHPVEVSVDLAIESAGVLLIHDAGSAFTVKGQDEAWEVEKVGPLDVNFVGATTGTQIAEGRLFVAITH
jgi:hypothetical protein